MDAPGGVESAGARRKHVSVVSETGTPASGEAMAGAGSWDPLMIHASFQSQLSMLQTNAYAVVLLDIQSGSARESDFPPTLPLGFDAAHRTELRAPAPTEPTSASAS
ncbi:hypothetical protein FVE85_1171 [Porphyridium purpureum]|uniref:Uncharacterized protein n=1 Tax=Porphyridium purpureum TaxID=35688 RepID=A0A5J4Z2R0_PORPP|nr:hypothetical protein FVE85_1171 [Porphyridium purpureum]|eukprot:POR2146..scf208_2